MELAKVRFIQFSGIFVGILIFLAAMVGNVIPGFVYPILFAVFGFLYTKWIWKWVTPRINFDGYWWGYTEYQVLERKIGNEIPQLPNKKPHLIKFHQDPFQLAIEASVGKDMVIWQADAITLYQEGRIVMAYSVKRKSGDIGFPLETKGYEEMYVIERNQFGSPTKLKGIFFHAAEPGKNLFRGETEYFKGKPPKNIDLEIQSR
jgi:hypothetical protein